MRWEGRTATGLLRGSRSECPSTFVSICRLVLQWSVSGRLVRPAPAHMYIVGGPLGMERVSGPHSERARKLVCDPGRSRTPAGLAGPADRRVVTAYPAKL